MTEPVLRYPLIDGYLHHWLVLGPLDFIHQPSVDGFAPLPQRELSVPRELDSLPWNGRAAFWITATCGEDHQLDWSGFLPVSGIRRAWAFAQIESPTEQNVTLAAAAIGQFSLWHNGKLLVPPTPQEDGQHEFAEHSVDVALCAGANNFLVRIDQTGVGHLAVALALRVVESNGLDLGICLPTVAHNIELRQRLETAFDQTYLDRAVYSSDQPVRLLVDSENGAPDAVHLRLQRLTGAIFSETTGKLSMQTPVLGARGVQLPGGEMQAVVMPPLGEFYERKLRARRSWPFWVVRAAPPKRVSAEERLFEAVEEAARRRDPFAEIAKIARGQWDQVRLSTLQEAAERVQQLHADVLPEAVALSGLLQTLDAQSPLPKAEVSRLRNAVGVFLEQGAEVLDLAQESDQLLFLTAWVLGQQREPGRFSALPTHFTSPSPIPAQTFLANWLAERGQRGFDVHASVDRLVLALSYLVGMSTDTSLRELAAVLLDRLLYDVAIHSIYGAYAPARGSTTSASLRSGRFTPEAALGRLLWGIGSYDGDIRSAIALGLAAQHYQLPEIIRSIALDRPQSMWVQERRQGDEDQVLVAHKTPNFLLSSLQDYHPGRRGQREQVWQATLSPEALVFTNHPTTLSQSDSRNAAWWVGNGTLPRVYQWQDALIAVYCLPPDDALGFTHAYFPTYAFDEYTFIADWAFARVGSGYVALWAAQGFDFVQRGQDAMRELRSVGGQNAWVCQMGNASLDGDFAQFQQSVLAQPVQYEADNVTWQTIRGDRLYVPWRGAVQRNGETVEWGNLAHHHSPYAYADLPASHMDIGIGAEVLRLDFRT